MADIFDDADVDAIYGPYQQQANGRSIRPLLLGQLSTADAELAATYFNGHAALYSSGFAVDACLSDLLAGRQAIDGFSGSVPDGWRKCIVFEMSKALDQLFYEHQRPLEAQAFAEWMAWTIEEHEWSRGSTDYLTALGERHQECLSIWLTVGPRRDAQTQGILAPSPASARRYLRP